MEFHKAILLVYIFQINTVRAEISKMAHKALNIQTSLLIRKLLISYVFFLLVLSDGPEWTQFNKATFEIINTEMKDLLDSISMDSSDKIGYRTLEITRPYEF